jgi:hypothetical protein
MGKNASLRQQPTIGIYRAKREAEELTKPLYYEKITPDS